MPKRDFSEVIRHCADKAYNFAFRLAGNDQDARDLVQEAFARALEHWGRYDQTRGFESWLFRILHNVYLDGVRRYAHGRTVSLDAPSPIEEVSWDEILPGRDPEPIEGLAREEADALVQKALAGLPMHYRTAVILRDVESLSYEEIARIMACPAGTVRSRIHQGRLMMKREFDKLMEGRSSR